MIRQPQTNLTTHKRLAVGALAAAATQALVVDLGARHDFTRVCGVKRGVASAEEALVIEQCHDGEDDTPTWVAAPTADLDGLNVSPASEADMVVSAAPGARWLRLLYTNGNTPQTDLVLELTLFPAA
jgi:hypothetical protein